ncbi:MAG: protein kinase [bacterium]|nr:protein kinase [bacterium]
MGVVYRARDPVLDREVAVKLVSLGDTPEAHEKRFRREAQVVASLDHPAIVPIFDFGRHDDDLYFVMPVVAGTTLHDVIGEGALGLGDTLEVVAQVAEALDYASSRGVVHRDVKPENIMVAREESVPRARIMDFGLALDAGGGRITKTGQVPGTLAYLSPEHILSLDLDGRSDLYSLGTILYECLVGEPPFSGAQGSVLFRIVHEEPPAVAVDETLAGIVRRCLAKEPKDRPARGNELAAELRSYRDTLSETSRERAPMVAGQRLPHARGSLATPLIGRAAELAELGRRLNLALSDECQLVLVGGEIGIGKTRLLLEVELRARARGVRVVRGRFSGQEGTFPHHGLCELIQDFYRSKAEGSSSTGLPDMADLAPELARRFPVLSGIADLQRAVGESPAGPPATTADDDPTQMFELLASALVRLASGKPAVLLLENLHAADTSIEALRYLVRRLGPTPTLVVGTYRQTEITRRHGVSRLLRDFADDPRFSLLILQPLTSEEHRDLVLSLLEASGGVGPRLEDELAVRLYEATEGNPFFTGELVRSLLDAGDITREDTGSWVLSSEAAFAVGALPETIQQAVEARLERLPEDLLRTLRTASVLGRSFVFQDLEGLVGDGERTEEAVDRLVRDGILEEDRRARGDVMHFSSGVVRDVLHGALTRRRRRSLHLRHASQLEERHAGRLERVYPQLVHHYFEGDEAVKTVTYALMLARMSVGVFSPADTIRATRTALELVEDEDLDDSGEVEGELRMLLARALRTVGNIAAALKEAGRAVRVFERRGELGPAASACLMAAETGWRRRRLEETRRWLGRGVELARAASERGTLRRLLTLAATVANLRGEHRQARSCLEEIENLPGDAASRPGRQAVPSGGTLRAALSNAPTTDDPVASFSLEDAEVLANVFDPLLGSDAEGNLVPRLCREWEGSEDGQAFVLTLRDGVRFSDGTPLTALEVKRSLEGAARRGAGHPVAALAVLRGVAAFLDGEADEIRGIESLDDGRIRFGLSERLPLFPALLTDIRTAMARDAGGALAGTGPFRIESWQSERIVLERNPRDWRKSPARLDRVELRVFDDASSIAAGLRSGELDLARDLSPEDLDAVLREPRFRDALVEAPKKNVYFVLFNLDGPMARRPQVRRALARSVRTQDLVWRTLGRFAQPATCLIPPGILGHDPARQRPQLAREEAAAELRWAGASLPIVLKAAAHPFFTDRYGSLLQALLDEWRAFGVDVQVEASTMESYLAAWKDCRQIDLLFGRWVPDYDDPDNLTYVPFHSREGLLHCYLTPDESRAAAGESLDDLLEMARHEPARSRRRVIYRRIESRLTEDDALLPLFHDVGYRIAGPRLRGLRHLASPPFVNYSELGLEAAASEERREERLAGSHLRVPLPTTFDSLDPALALFVEPAEVVPNVFETLTRVGEGARIEPCLAAETRLEDGGRRLRVRLREDVRFHDGRRLSSRDVRYSFERLLRSPYAGVETALLPIRGAPDLRAGRSEGLYGLEIKSARELVIELSGPVGFFPAMLSNPMTAIVPEGSTGFTGTWRSGCAGTGPFRVAGVFPGERIELEANPNYWRQGEPRCRRLTFELGIDPERLDAAFRAGDLSIATGLRPSDVERLRREAEHSHGFREAPGFSTYFLALNSRRGPFADPALRHAFVAAIDVEAVVEATMGRMGIPADGLIAPGLLGHEARERGHGSSPSATSFSSSLSSSVVSAPRILAGLEIETSVHSVYSGQYAHVWRELRSAIGAAGVKLNVIGGPMSELLERIKRGDVHLAAARRIAAYPDADAFVNLFHSSDGLLGQLIDDPEIDRLIEQGRAESDSALRHAAYREIEQIFEREALLIPLFDEQVYCFTRPEVRGLRLRFGWPRVAYHKLSVEY